MNNIYEIAAKNNKHFAVLPHTMAPVNGMKLGSGRKNYLKTAHSTNEVTEAINSDS